MYFVFTRLDDGEPLLQVFTQDGIKKFLDEMTETPPSRVKFLTNKEITAWDKLESLCADLHVDTYLIIKGEIVTPTPVEIVTKLGIK